MTTYPSLRRCLLLGMTAAIFGLIGVMSVRPVRSLDGARAGDAVEPGQTDRTHVWPLFGGPVQRNTANTFENNVPTEWNFEQRAEKNSKHVARRAYTAS